MYILISYLWQTVCGVSDGKQDVKETRVIGENITLLNTVHLDL